MSESLATVLKLAVAAVLIVALIAAGKWAMGRFNTEVKNVDTSSPGQFQAPN
jgi:hypothetical protein